MNQSPGTDEYSLEFLKGSLYRLRNNTLTDVVVEQIDNKDEFVRLDLKVGTEVPARRSTEFIIAGALQKPLPGELVVGFAGADAPAVIPIPPKP